MQAARIPIPQTVITRDRWRSSEGIDDRTRQAAKADNDKKARDRKTVAAMLVGQPDLAEMLGLS